MIEQDEEDIEMKKILEGNPEGKYLPAGFIDPVEMLTVVMPNFANGVSELYKWQVETNKFLASNVFTKQDPLMFILCASNGSGKDAYVISPFACWHAACKIRSRLIITSSSFQQLKYQTEPGIRAIAQGLNQYLGEKVFLIKHFHIVAKNTGSEILMFATDDPGLAEGYHPFPDYDGAEMTILVNESKTVKDEIFAALRRCNGYNRWIEVSSPGQTSGHMYNMYRRSTQHPERYKAKSTVWYSRRITSFDCPHISRKVIEDDKLTYGENSPIYRSMHLAEFTSLEGNLVIPQESLNKLQNSGVMSKEGRISAGWDLAFSLGGDETVGYLINGNKIIDHISTRISDVVALKDFVKEKQRYWQETHGLKSENTFVDHGNAGRAIVDMLRAEGMPVNGIMNQSSAIDKTRFANRGAELWYNVKRLVDECVLVLDPRYHSKLLTQLASRYFKQHAVSGKIVLESKQEARANGHGSPDHADAYVLAFVGLTIRDFIENYDERSKEKQAEGPRTISPEEAYRLGTENEFGVQKIKLNLSKSCRHSMMSILHDQEGQSNI